MPGQPQGSHSPFVDGNRIKLISGMKNVLLLLAVLMSDSFPSLAQPTITQQPVDTIVTNGGTAIFSVSVSGTGPFTYQWQFNGTNLPPLIKTLPVSGCGVAVDKLGNLYIADVNNYRILEMLVNGDIRTVAGNGTWGNTGDGGVATNATLYSPTGVAVDKDGNVFIADRQSCRIRKVDTNAIITTIAGSGVTGPYGDGGKATNAELAGPFGVAVDIAGNFFIADTANCRIRKVGTNGIITTVAGYGFNGGNVCDYYSDSRPAIGSPLNEPTGIAIDNFGNLFISDAGNNRIRKVGTNGIITTVAGNGLTGFSGDGGSALSANIAISYESYVPNGLAVDNYGNIFFADTGNNRIRKIDTNGIITTVAGNGIPGTTGDGGVATNAKLYSSTGVAIDEAGNLFIAGSLNGRIREVGVFYPPTLTLSNIINANGGFYSVVISDSTGSVTSRVVSLNIPAFVLTQPQDQTAIAGGTQTFSVNTGGTGPFNYQWTFNGNTILNATNSSYTLNNISTNNGGSYSVNITNLYGSVDSCGAILTVAQINQQPIDQVLPDGGMAQFSVVISGSGSYTYQWQFNGTNIPASGIITTVAGNGTPAYFGDGTRATNTSLYDPSVVTVDAVGNLFIADTGNNRIRKVNTNGIITTVAGNGTASFYGDGGLATSAELFNPYGVAVDNLGNILIADTFNRRIRKVTTNGIITTVAGGGISLGDGGMANSAQISPRGVAIDILGNLFIADSGNNRIRKVPTNGIITTVAGIGTNLFSGDGGRATNAALNFPLSVAVDSSGNLLIADSANSRIRKVGTNGIITTVAGNGTAGYSGDCGAATNAQLYSPSGVTVDGNGNILISETSNCRIRKVGTNGIITTVAGNGTNSFSGDGCFATSTALNRPFGIVADINGNLFIADSSNNRIRKVVGTPDYPTVLPTLILANVSSQNMGNYSVVIGYSTGSVTSSMAALTIFLPPKNFSASGASGNQLSLQLAGTPNYPYILQSTTNLTQPVNWQPVLTNLADTNGNWQFTDTNLNGVQKFYRAVGQ